MLWQSRLLFLQRFLGFYLSIIIIFQAQTSMEFSRKLRSTSEPPKAISKIPQRCHFHKKGYCKWGNYCKYIHSIKYVAKPNSLPQKIAPSLVQPKKQEISAVQLKLNEILVKLREDWRESSKLAIRNRLLEDYQPKLEQPIKTIKRSTLLQTLDREGTQNEPLNSHSSCFQKNEVDASAPQLGWDQLSTQVELPNTGLAACNQFIPPIPPDEPQKPNFENSCNG